VNTLGGNDGKRNGSIVIRWNGRPDFLQGVCTTFNNTLGLGPSTIGYLLPQGFIAPLTSTGPSSLSIPWYVDNAGAGSRVPPQDGRVTSIVYLHNNNSLPITCEIEYYTQDGIYIGPLGVIEKQFTVPADSSIAFRPVADDPASAPGGQEAPPGRAVPNRPLGTANGNDNKKNGALVIRWTGSPYAIQGVSTTYGSPAGMAPVTSANPTGMAVYGYSYLLPSAAP
jgi:hypothetical protein